MEIPRHASKSAFYKWIPWLAGILAATLLFGLLAIYAGFQYSGSDDTPILRSFMGYEGGAPAYFHPYTHTALAWLLYGLALLFPGVAWFSILQLLLLWFSCVVLMKSMTQITLNHGLPLLVGVLGGAVFLAVYTLYIACKISYTTTGALVGASAVAQLMSINWRESRVLRGMLLSIALLLCCYCLRQINVLPSMAFWLLALALVIVKYPQRAKPALLGLLIGALSFGLLAGARAVEIKTLDQENFLQWQKARTRLFDYTYFTQNTSVELMEEAGWSPAEFHLVTQWFFMNQNISTEAFDTLYSAQPEAAGTTFLSFFSQKLPHAIQTLLSFYAANPSYFFACGLLHLIALLSLLRLKGDSLSSLFAPLGLLLGAVILFYLGYQRRLPMRAAVSIIFPCAAFQFCLCLRCQKETDEWPRRGRAFITFICFCALGMAVLSMSQTILLLKRPATHEVEARSAIPVDLDAFALKNPECLIIYDFSLVADQRLFPDTSKGIPTNLMFWGGWPARSPSWLHQLSQYGIDDNALDASVFLQDHVLCASIYEEPGKALLNYVDESVEGDIGWSFHSKHGDIYFFKLYRH